MSTRVIVIALWIGIATLAVISIYAVFAPFMVHHDQNDLQKFCDKLNAQAVGDRGVCIRDHKIVYQR